MDNCSFIIKAPNSQTRTFPQPRSRSIIIIILILVYLGKDMKSSQRMGFRKRGRNNFIQRFKTEVKESRSIEYTRTSFEQHSHYQVANSLSPQRNRPFPSQSSLQADYCLGGHPQCQQKSLKTAKVKLSLVSKQSQKAIIRSPDSVQIKQRGISLKEDRLFQSESRQNESCNVQDGGIQIFNTQELILATRTLEETSQKLKKYRSLDKQTQELDALLMRIAEKVNYNSGVQSDQKQSVKKRLCGAGDGIPEERLEESESRTVKIQPETYQWVQNGRQSKPGPIIESISSFKIENEESHWNQHLHIYEHNKKTVRSSSSQDFTLETGGISTRDHRITSALPHITESSSKQSVKGASSTSSVEQEQQRLTLNQIISLLNLKYNKSAHLG